MENKKNTGLIVLVIMLFIIVLGLSGFIGYHIFVEDVNTKNKNSKTIKKLDNTIKNLTSTKIDSYTYEDLEGVYLYEKNLPDINDKAIYKLTLNSNGTFIYSSYTLANSGYIGNYIIDNNIIKLNYIFKHGSDVSLEITNGKKELTILSKNKIMDNDPEKVDDSIKKVELKKQSEIKDEDKYDLNKNLTDVVDTGAIYSKNSTRP